MEGELKSSSRQNTGTAKGTKQNPKFSGLLTERRTVQGLKVSGQDPIVAQRTGHSPEGWAASCDWDFRIPSCVSGQHYWGFINPGDLIEEGPEAQRVAGSA